jgi:DNA-binding NarL/FixJ family response regulator
MSGLARILIIDDHGPTRAGLVEILGSDGGIEVVGDAGTAFDGERLAMDLRPDVVLIDVGLPDLDGIAATKRILDRTDHPGLRVIVMTTFERDDQLHRSLMSGASGFLLKRMPAEAMIEAVKVVAEGQLIAAPDAEAARVSARPGLPDTLTGRELDVLRFIAPTASDEDIAARVRVSRPTAGAHARHICWSSGVRDDAQAVIAAYEQGIVVVAPTPDDAEP